MRSEKNRTVVRRLGHERSQGLDERSDELSSRVERHQLGKTARSRHGVDILDCRVALVGRNNNGVVDNGKVRVPSKVWKVVVVIPKGNSDINRIDRNATVLCVSMPNDNRLYTTGNQTAWRNYIISVSALEIESTSNGTALSLFSNIPEAERTVLKSKIYQ